MCGLTLSCNLHLYNDCWQTCHSAMHWCGGGKGRGGGGLVACWFRLCEHCCCVGKLWGKLGTLPYCGRCNYLCKTHKVCYGLTQADLKLCFGNLPLLVLLSGFLLNILRISCVCVCLLGNLLANYMVDEYCLGDLQILWV